MAIQLTGETGAVTLPFQDHVSREALRAARVAGGEKSVTVDNLTVMAARDPLLAEGLFRLGLQKAATVACNDFEAMVRTAGAYAAHHPENSSD